MQSDVVPTMMRRLMHGEGVAMLPVPALAVDLVSQRLMSRWGVSENAARGMIAIEKLGVSRTTSPDSSQAPGFHGMTRLFVRPASGGTLRQAEIGKGDLFDVIEELRHMPGRVKPSRFSDQVAHLLEMAFEQSDASVVREIPDGESDAIHWALERLVADGRKLSPGLHDFAEVVAH
jgi:hypothetical protein